MPYLKAGVQRTEWRRCDICGLLTPVSKMRRQLGAIRCPECCDDLSPYYRQYQIAQVLSQPGEGTSEQGEKFKDVGETVRF